MKTYVEFQEYIQKHEAVIAYYSHDMCSVCTVLKPKVKEKVEEHFPKIKFIYVNILETPEISSQQSIFTVPTLIVYFEGKESLRKSRNISIDELQMELERSYEILFS